MSVLEKEYPLLFQFILEQKIAVYYNPSRRSFSIGSKELSMVQEISYCPWSGQKLPRSLSDEFSKMLESRDLSALEPETWPKEWRTEAWWIRAGL